MHVMHVSLYSYKGGSGVTVTTAALAMELARRMPTIIHPSEDTAAALGIFRPEAGDMVTTNLWWDDLDKEGLHLWDNHWGRGDLNLLVTRACYLSLARAVRNARECKPDGIVLLKERDRALNEKDVSGALGAPVVARIPVTSAVSRVVDAGLLGARPPQQLKDALIPLGDFIQMKYELVAKRAQGL